MKHFLIGLLLAILIPTISFAEAPVWKGKPVQCGSTEDIYKHYIDPEKLEPIFLGVGNVMKADGEMVSAAILFYVNFTSGVFLVLEQGDHLRDMCIISLGVDLQLDVDSERMRKLLTDDQKS